MLGHQDKEVSKAQKRIWNFKFQTRAFRQVVIIEKDDNPVGYINLDSDEDVELWKEVQEKYFK